MYKLYPAAIFTAALILSAHTITAQNTKIDLSGTWTTESGEEVEIVQLDTTITSTFTAPPGQPAGDCPNGGHRGKYIDGKLVGRTLSGTMMRCTVSKALVEDCGEALFGAPLSKRHWSATIS